MTDEPRISVVIVSYFTGPLLARALASARAQDGVKDVIVVDNGNWDGAVQAALAEGGRAPARALAGHGNIGFAAACNMGAREATGDYLLFLNPDAMLPPGGAARLVADGAAAADKFLIGAKIVDPDGREQKGSRRQALTPWRAFVEMTKLYRLAPNHPYFQRFNMHEQPCPATVAPAPTISGACFALRRRDYFAIDGMDERYFLHVEDIDFCLRFTQAGGAVMFDPHVVVTHYKSSSRVSTLRVEFRKARSLNLYFRRHFSNAYPRGFLPLVGALVWAAFAVRGAVGAARAAAHAFRRVGLRGARRARAIFRRRAQR